MDVEEKTRICGQSCCGLSQELIDEIIDFVAADPCTSVDDGFYHLSAQNHLQRCALVSRAFRWRSQHFLFERVKFSGMEDMYERQAEQLLDILEDNPSILEHFRELIFEFDVEGSSFDNYTHVFHFDTFIKFMERTSSSSVQFRRFVMAPEDDGSLQLDRDEYLLNMEEEGQGFLDDFFLPFVATFLTSLSLHRICDVPVEMLTSCVNLQSLELLNVRLATELDPDAAILWRRRRLFQYVLEDKLINTPFPLRYLTSETDAEHKTYSMKPLKLLHLAQRLSRHAVAQLLDLDSDGAGTLLDLSQLQKYTIYTDIFANDMWGYPIHLHSGWMYRKDLKFEQKIIDMTSKSLEEVEVITLDATMGSKFDGFLDFQHCSKLRSLNAHTPFPEDKLVFIRDTLSTVQAGSLKSLFIEAKVSFGSKNCKPEAVLEGEWADLCAEITRVMAAGQGARFDFKMTYRCTNAVVAEIGEMTDFENETQSQFILRLAKEALAAVREEKLALLMANTGFTVTTTLAIEYEYDWDWY